MDNMVIRKMWSDDGSVLWDSNFLFGMKLTCINDNLTISEEYYMCNENAKKISNTIKKFVKTYKEQKVDFINKKENTIEGFSFRILPADSSGHVLIEVEMGSGWNTKQNHYSIFNIKTELGLLEKFGSRIEKLSELNDEEISLN